MCAIIKFTFPCLRDISARIRISSTLDTDLAQRKSDAGLAVPEGKRGVERDPRRVYAGIVEFGPLLAFTACLMNFEKLAHGSPQ